MTKTGTWNDRTIAARAGVDEDPVHGAITPSAVFSSNFSFEGFGRKRVHDYTRTSNPTRDTLGRAVAELEGGHNAVITSTGMAAVNLVLADLAPGDLVIAPHDCYGGTYRLLTERARLGHFRVEFVDLTCTAREKPSFAARPRLVLIETPSNPLLRITDIRAVARTAKKAGALVVADNTFLSPVLQKPLDLGADIVVHSLTKYINGHSDVVAGAVVSKTPELHERFAFWANTLGLTGAPFDGWLMLRGLRTLELRVRAQTETAGEMARYLAARPGVARVYYPGLAAHPGHKVAARQQKGYGAMLAFELADPARVEPFVNALTRTGGLFSLAESLGGFESLIAHPVTMTHAAMDPEARKKAGISDALLRVSIGLETAQDLKAGLADAFAAIARKSGGNKPRRRRKNR